jgi:hypothetical protein
MLGGFNKMLDKVLDKLGLLNNEDAFRGVSLNARLNILKPKPKSLMDITLRIEKLSGKCLFEKNSDLVLRNLVRLLYHMFANYAGNSEPSITVTDITGASYSGYIGTAGSINGYARNAFLWYNQGDVGDASTGIVIGIGTTPPARTDYAMQAKIPHGTGVGQIYYNRQIYELLSDYQFRLTREFTNAGSDLSVAEAGLIYNTQISYYSRTLLLLRDTFTPVSVATGNGIRVRYTFSF